MGAEVDRAFRERPRLVENATGFRGIEILRDAADPDIFYLFTRWDDLHSYESWHYSPAHDESHCRIPKGLKLDPAYTRIDILADEKAGEEDRLGDFLSKSLSSSQRIHHVRMTVTGEIQCCSPALCHALGLGPEAVIGANICDFLVESDAISLPDRLKNDGQSEEFILNFVREDFTPFSVKARLFLQSGVAVLIAESDLADETDFGRNFIDLNNEFVRLTRELQQKNRELTKARNELARALEERDKSYWYIRKLHEVLPFCMGCKKVKAAESSWEPVEDFLRKNTRFLSHGYCPECIEKWKRGEL